MKKHRPKRQLTRRELVRRALHKLGNEWPDLLELYGRGEIDDDTLIRLSGIKTNFG